MYVYMCVTSPEIHVRANTVNVWVSVCVCPGLRPEGTQVIVLGRLNQHIK